jgi:DNA-binding NtrC family response regulator
MRLLEAYAWPGNIRELKNVIERAALLCTADLITASHFPIEKLTRGRKLRAATGDDAADAAAIERARIIAALEASGGNQREAAKALGIARGTLIKRMEELNLPRPRKRSS